MDKKQPYGKDQQRFLNCFPLQALILVNDRHKLMGKNWMDFRKGGEKEVEKFGRFFKELTLKLLTFWTTVQGLSVAILLKI